MRHKTFYTFLLYQQYWIMSGNFYHQRMRRRNAYGRICTCVCVSVCLSVCVCLPVRAVTCESFSLETSVTVHRTSRIRCQGSASFNIDTGRPNGRPVLGFGHPVHLF